MVKIRMGLVSNSSSSSFIVTFPHDPKNEEDVFDMMFPGKDREDHYTIYDYVTHLGVISQQVWQDIQEHRIKNRKPNFKYKLAEGETKYYFHYSDNDGELGTIMEHGDIFSNLERERESHH